MSKTLSRVVFVGNIPYDSAASAVRNLNDYETMGRKLRVDFSNEGGTDDNDFNQGRDGLSFGAPNTYGQAAPAAPQASTLPPLPPGKELPANITATDAISRTLNTLPPSQLLDILTQMKALASNDPARATELLQQAPQLSYAVFQALLLMGLVSPEAIHSVLEPSSGVPAPQALPAGFPPQGVPGYPPAGATNTPPVAATPYPAPPQPVYGAPAPAPAPALGHDTDALMRQVMELPIETINTLPESGARPDHGVTRTVPATEALEPWATLKDSDSARNYASPVVTAVAEQERRRSRSHANLKPERGLYAILQLVSSIKAQPDVWK
ncbi:RNA-binding protein [Verticillium alfalfae VaMs.102]|uniref:RNA-binding protein n=1 Tax=Verticillium alfalfae (strain VaMs.102 / ATCC MYA-4576 / FGSC 10136) TaxID=526221 RepID=C9SI30_VERA1|nr:RNA-binding protein [Verticillium alfalfae VaMs.102]EEY18603.1 RNA-binding protein [Verticillium alfalfae VaMs.102]